MKKWGKLLLACSFMFSMVGCSSSSDSQTTIEKIKEEGVLKVGVKDDRIGFGLKNTSTGEYEGYEINIAKAIAKDILGDESKIEFTAVNAKTRTGLLDNGEIDCVVATFTITDERKESWNFSKAYYTDNVGVMVKKGKYSAVKDMDGATIAVQQSSTSKDALDEYAKGLGISLKYKEYSSAAECVSAVNSNAVDAYSIDVTSLLSYVNDSLVILPDRFSPQEFGIATRKDDDEMTEEVSKVLESLEKDGSLDKWQEEFEIVQGS